MIISASRRTDIPAFYMPWLMNRLREGFVMTRNPMNPAQVKRISLLPEDVDCIVFWTKDPAPLLPYLSELDEAGYRYYFQFTLTPYGREVEKNLRGKQDIFQTFVQLSGHVGKHRVLWRYDPILLQGKLDEGYHLRQFEDMAKALQPYTDSVTISFVDNYAKLKEANIREATDAQMHGLANSLAKIAASAGLSIRACCEKTDYTVHGIKQAHCIDRELIEKLCGHPLALKPDKNQRPGCGCAQSVDIGAYNTCKNGCIYCYANYSAVSVAANCWRHDPAGEFLIGGK